MWLLSRTFLSHLLPESSYLSYCTLTTSSHTSHIKYHNGAVTTHYALTGWCSIVKEVAKEEVVARKKTQKIQHLSAVEPNESVYAQLIYWPGLCHCHCLLTFTRYEYLQRKSVSPLLCSDTNSDTE